MLRGGSVERVGTLGGGGAIGGTITGGTTGSVLFIGAASVLAQDNANFFWDDANNRLGIGTASPSAFQTIASPTAADNSFTGPGNLVSNKTDNGSTLAVYHNYFQSQGIDRWFFQVTPNAAVSATAVSMNFGYNLGSAFMGLTNMGLSFINGVTEVTRFTNASSATRWVPQGGSCNLGDGNGDAYVDFTAANGLRIYNLSVATLIAQITGTTGSRFFAPSASIVPLTARCAASQSADVFQAQTSAGSTYIGITPNALRFVYAADTAPATGNGLFDGNGPLIFSTGGTRYLATGRYDGANGRTGILISAGSQLMFSNGSALSGGNFNTADVALVRTAIGNMKVTDGTTGGGFGSLAVGAYSASTVALKSVAFSGQTANNQEWQNIGGTAYVFVGPPTLAGDSATKNFFNITATMPTTMTASTIGAQITLTTAGSSNQIVRGFHVDMLSGYTGANYCLAFTAQTQAASTGASAWNLGVCNAALGGTAYGTTVGDNVGFFGDARNGDRNYGCIGLAQTAKNNKANVGVLGNAQAGGGTGMTLVGGFFGLVTSQPTYATAALMCDNGSTTSDIFVARDNGTAVFTIADNGASTFAVGSASSVIVKIRAAAAQSANMTEWQNSSSTVGSFVDSLCGFTLKRLTNTTTAHQILDSSGGYIVNIDSINNVTCFGTTNTESSTRLYVAGDRAYSTIVAVSPDGDNEHIWITDGNESFGLKSSASDGKNYIRGYGRPISVESYKFSTYVGTSTVEFATIGGRIFEHIEDVGNTGTGEDDLYTDTIAANVFGLNADAIVAQYSGTFASSATATRQLRCYFAGTLIYDSSALSLSVSADWDMQVTVIRENSSAVRCMVTVNTTTASAAPYAKYTRITGLTLSGTNILKITGEAAGVGAATNDIVARLGRGIWEGQST